MSFLDGALSRKVGVWGLHQGAAFPRCCLHQRQFHYRNCSTGEAWNVSRVVRCAWNAFGAYSLFEITTRPGDGPLPHVQHWEDEFFYVLEGEYEFLDEGRTLRAGVGYLIYVPRGNLHAHKNVGERPAKMLVSQTPRGSHERFFEEVGRLRTEGKALDPR